MPACGRESMPMRRATPRPHCGCRKTPRPRWLYVINILGLASVAIFLCVFGWRMLSGIDISESLPEISAATRESILMNGSTIIATVALAIGFLFTPWGRRVRDEFG